MSATTQDSRVRELSLFAPRVRTDLKFVFQRYGQQDYYVVEDPIHHRFFRLGPREYKFISLLDGKTTLAEAAAIMAGSMEDPLDESEIARLVNWLLESQLVYTRTSVETQKLHRSALKSQKKWMQRASELLSTKISLFNPDRFFTAIAPFIRFFWGKLFLVAWLCLIGFAVYLISDNWNRFISSAQGVFAVSNWLWLYLAWAFLKAFHEMAHGLCCKHYGGTVTEIGVILILFSPLGYAETTSSWRFPSKWQRMHVAAAGMFVELLIAAIATIIWSETTHPGALRSFTYDVICIASVSTILFNINPLMRFDGYYILIDLLERPNLYTHSRNYLFYLGKRYLLGVSLVFPIASAKERLLLGTYGILSLFWRITISITLILAAATLFLGAGIILSGIALILWIIVPLWRFTRYLFGKKENERPRLLRFAFVLSLFCLSLGWLTNKLSYQENFYASVVVVYNDEETIRSYAPGFVEEIFVHDKQMVEPGMPLLRLKNHKLAADIKELEVDLQLSKIRLRIFDQRQNIAATQVESENYAAIEKRLRESQVFADSLLLKAQKKGIIINRNLANFQGRYFDTGMEILRIGNPDSKIFQAAIHHEYIEVFQRAMAEGVEIKMNGRENFTLVSQLSHLSPRASYEIPADSLTNIAGGSLTILDENGQKRLSEPHFTGKIVVPTRWKGQLKVGETGWMRLQSKEISLFQYIQVTFAREWRKIREQYELYR